MCDGEAMIRKRSPHQKRFIKNTGETLQGRAEGIENLKEESLDGFPF